VKKLLLFFFVFLFLFAPIPPSFAQTKEPIDENRGFTLSPEPDDIDGATDTVKVTFTQLVSGQEYYVCLRSDGCASYFNQKTKLKTHFKSDGSQKVFSVCADSEDTLKEKDDCADSDYFHEAKMYGITLFGDENGETLKEGAYFFVNHFMPEFKIEPPDINENSGPMKVTISGLRKPFNNGKRNNYEVVVEGIDRFGKKFKRGSCTTAKPNNPGVLRFGRNDGKDSLAAGTYLVKINEHINEDNKLKPDFNHACEGGFTYYHIPVTVGLRFQPGIIGETVMDPNNSDMKSANKFLDEIFNTKTVSFPCHTGNKNATVENCGEMDTALGKIPTNPVGFIKKLLSIILSIASLGATLIIIYAGYRMMMSRGNKEGIQAARETLTAAIIGLLFIIFSLVILNVIGADILKLPGFTR